MDNTVRIVVINKLRRRGERRSPCGETPEVTFIGTAARLDKLMIIFNSLKVGFTKYFKLQLNIKNNRLS